MVNFNGLEDLVVKLEQEIVSVTQELSNVKGEIDRVKREYHEETTPKDDKGIRQFMLERAEARFGQNFDKPEGIPEVLDELYELTDREVKKESIVLGIKEKEENGTSDVISNWLGSWLHRYLFTEKEIIEYAVGKGKRAGRNSFNITNFADIKRVRINHDEFSVHLVCDIVNDEGNEDTMNLFVAEDNQKKMQSFLRDILEYVNK
ncbi:MAG: hypothetical protein MR304_05545 [Eubacterium sp.]|nr:hypothetical protein [Eubacterium sp.]